MKKPTLLQEGIYRCVVGFGNVTSDVVYVLARNVAEAERKARPFCRDFIHYNEVTEVKLICPRVYR